MADLKHYHILTSSAFNLILLVVTFSADNPVVLLGIFALCLSIFLFTGNLIQFKRGFLYFIPFSLLNAAINFFFNGEGKQVLFIAFGRNFTLEALIYAFILSFKLLLIIYIFSLLQIMSDSDRAVSYFSARLPKSTLLLLIAFKLFPAMKSRLSELKDIYAIRGVNFEGKTLGEKLKSYLPVMSILLESSLEGAFDIGEAAYVRGFLSGKRTLYDRQRFKTSDRALLINSFVYFLLFIAMKLYGLDKFDIYGDLNLSLFMSPWMLCSFAAALTMAANIAAWAFRHTWQKEKKE